MEAKEEMKLAKELAERYHKGQADKIGVPYIEHIYAVANKVDTEEGKTVAYLHDTVEDTGMTLEKLREYGFEENIVNAVDAMTRRDGEDYFDYIRRVKEHPVARIVKLADLAHNTSPERYKEIPQEVGEVLMKKYKKAIDILTS